MSNLNPLAEDPGALDVASEIELKFALSAIELERVLQHPALRGRGRTQAMSSIYFDSPRLHLRRAGLTLRVRKSGRSMVQTVKRGRPTDLFNRDEWETPLQGAEPDWAAAACTPAGRVLSEAGVSLAPVFSTDIRRTVRVYSFRGATIELSVDQGDVRAGQKSESICELELELKSGDRAVLFALAQDMFATVPMRLCLTSKSERGFRLNRPSLTGKASTPALAPEMTVADAFAAVARSCLIQIADAADAFHREPSARAVHQTRVGIRRMRTTLKLFGALVSGERRAWMITELRWLAGELGQARELDVFEGDIFTPVRSSLSDTKAGDRYAVKLAKARAAAYAQAGAAVSSTRFATLIFEMALWLEQGDWRQGDQPDQRPVLDSAIGPFAVDALTHLRALVRRRGSGLDQLDAERQHDLRLRAKRLRYATKFFANALGEEGDKKRREFASAVTALQDSLGRLNDIAQVRETSLVPLEGRTSSDLTFTAGEITGWARSQHSEVSAEASRAFEDFVRAKRFWPRRGNEGR